tara:strand:+ start:300 stop:983 length:684 start_codon:yes stop_codon:yes gene_type:complete
MISKDLQIFIQQNIINNNPKAKYLETGFLKGQSANEMLKLGFKKVVSIEIDEDFIKKGEIKFKNEIKDNRLEIIKGDSAEKISEYFSEEYDVVFLDAHGTSVIDLVGKSAPLEKEINFIVNKGLKDHQILIIDDYLKIKYHYLFAFNSFDWRFLANRKLIDNLIKKLNKKTYQIPYKGNSYLIVIGNNFKYQKNLIKDFFYKIYNLDFLIKYSFYLLKRVIKISIKK